VVGRTLSHSIPVVEVQTSLRTADWVVPPMTHILSEFPLGVKVKKPKSSLAGHAALVVAAAHLEPISESERTQGPGVIVGVMVKVGVKNVPVGVGVMVGVNVVVFVGVGVKVNGIIGSQELHIVAMPPTWAKREIVKFLPVIVLLLVTVTAVEKGKMAIVVVGNPSANVTV